MTWENYGEWRVDHIKPISSFNFTDINDDEFKKCWPLENLQPLCEKEN
jgi:5-methylcytosine-specific restriction endonuclease McrA